MFHKFLSLAVLACAAQLSHAEGLKLRYQWVKGHVLTYQLEHKTQVVSSFGDDAVRTSNDLRLTKQWTVLDVDREGIATLQLTLLRMRVETSSPKGEKFLFDSDNPDNNNPEMKKFVGAPVAVLRVNRQGSVVEVKQSKFGPESRYQQQLPFVCELPSEDVSVGSRWRRSYEIVLEPPQGTGEKYPAEQSFACQSFNEGIAKISMQTVVKKLPEAFVDQIPLIQAKPRGTIDFDAKNGRFLGAELAVQEDVKTGQRAGVQQYQFQSTYRERLISHR